jgi:PAS domain S-box-containing protein
MKKQKILVIDNEKAIVEMIATILEEQGYDVDKAYRGFEALEKLKNHKYAMVFLDLLMPRIKGEKICQFVKHSPGHRATKVIIISDIALEEQDPFGKMGADAFVAKCAFPQMKNNILKAIDLMKNIAAMPPKVVFGKEHIAPRKTVKKLLLVQKHLEAILNSMHDGFLELDTRYVINYCNPAAQAILEKKERELIGKNFIDEFEFSNKKKIASILKKLFAKDATASQRISSGYKDKDLSFSFSNVLNDEVLMGFAVIVHDITESIELERERAARERMTGVIEMAGAVAHEINQPLTTISGHAQLLLMDAEGRDEKICRRARIIFDQVQILGNLTKKIANITSYETKEYGKNLRIVDIYKSSTEHQDYKSGK